MIDCTTCAPALPLMGCPESLTIGGVADGLSVVVRFTDRATGRVVVSDVDDALLPLVVVPVPPPFAPDHSVVVEVLALLGGVPVAPVEFFPYEIDAEGEPIQAVYPVVCIVFTWIKTFDLVGSIYPGGPRTLILQ
jgi:hypothetical protein